jgi:cytochrome c oxidase subunit IV
MSVRYNAKEERVSRKINLFEIVLLLVGLAVIFVGAFAIRKQFMLDGYLTWGLLQGIFLWLILLVLLIIAAIMENVKEELCIIICEHIEETKLLRDEARTLKDVVKRKK